MDLIPNGTPASLTGWTDFPTTWTYASATTFTVSGDVTAIFGVGTKLKWTQSSTAYYGYVASSSYSSPNTTVTVAGNAVLNDTISNPKYSYASNPQGFPHWFSYTPTIGGVSSQPVTSFNYCINGRLMTIVLGTGEGNSNDTVFTATLPPITPIVYCRAFGIYQDNSTWGTYPGLATIASSASSITFTTPGFAGWTATGKKEFSCTIMVYI